MPGDTTTWIADDLIEEAIIPDSQNQPSDDAQLAAQTSLTEILTILQSLQSGDDSIEDIQSKLSLSRANLDELRAFIDSITLIPIIDTFDDLIAAANTPGVTPELFKKYVDVRERLTSIPEIDDTWRPLAASLDFLDRIRPVTNPNGWDQPNNNTIESWTSYLEKYPNSPKAEAASLRLLRLQVRSACPIPHVRGFHFPESRIANGYKRLVIIDPSEDFDPKALNAALAAHRATYPANRYDADLTLLEAAVASRAEDYQTAIRKLTSVLSNKQHPELRQDAALYFAELSLRLLNPEKRPSLVTEFIKTPRALDYLNNLANGDTCVSRVRPLLTSMRPLPR